MIEQIDDNIPPPVRTPQKSLTKLVRSLPVGSSFAVPVSRRKALQYTVWTERQLRGTLRFTTWTVEEDGERVVRCWRLEDGIDERKARQVFEPVTDVNSHRKSKWDEARED